MAGYRRPHTTSFSASDKKAFDTLNRAFEGAEYPGLSDRSFKKKTDYERKRQSAPITYATIRSSDEGSGSEDEEVDQPENDTPEILDDPAAASPQLVQTGLRPAKRLATPPKLTRDDSGLPPTPPTMANSLANSDHNAPTADSLAKNVLFADAVRNALHAQKSGLSSPKHEAPLTPDASPPVTYTDLKSMRQMQPPPAPPLLPQFPSSRAESFRTARETPSRSQAQTPHTPLAKPTADSRHHDFSATRTPKGLGVVYDNGHPSQDQEDGGDEDEIEEPSTPTYARRTRRAPSPYRPSDSDADLEKHISYISNDDEDFKLHGGLAGLVMNVPFMDSTSEQTSAEDLNNAVYQQIQDENIKRNSAIMNGNAVTAGVFYAEIPERQHTLKRTTRRDDLRTFSDDDSEIRRDSLERTPKQLRHKRGSLPSRSLEASPVIASKPLSLPKRRVVTEPTNAMTKLTESAMTGPDSNGNGNGNGLGRQHTLRHPPKASRLENNGSIRRTSDTSSAAQVSSLDGSPQLGRQKTIRHFSRASQLQNNASLQNSRSVRRTSLDAALPSNSLRRSSDISPERKLRHFSAASKLENNTHVRGTSLDSNGSFLPTSPRKSIDARMLHPSTTPVSQSQFSDRSEMEVCEAQGVSIYPHNNESLLVVQNGSRPSTKDTATPPKNNYLGMTNHQMGIGLPLFATTIEPPTPRLGAVKTEDDVDSPFTHPRAAPEPPEVIRIIPPTPSEELERELSAPRLSTSPAPFSARPGGPQRSPSLIKRARRWSESYIQQPLFGRAGSLRKQNKPTMDISRPQNLSPMWQPRPIWTDDDDYLGDEDLDDWELDDLPDAEDRLPPGGDTSSVKSRKRRGFLPRSLSLRLPGFRNKGAGRQYVVRKRSSGGMGSRGAYVSEGSRMRTW